MTLRQITAFFARPGINLSGICKEAGISSRALHKCLHEGRVPGHKIIGRLETVMKGYGWKNGPM